MKKMRERTELTEKGQQRRLMLLSAAIMIFVAQLDLLGSARAAGVRCAVARLRSSVCR